VAMPLAGAVHLNHTERLPGLPPWFGSPTSRVAFVLLDRITPPPSGESPCRPLKSSLPAFTGTFVTSNGTAALFNAPSALHTTTL